MNALAAAVLAFALTGNGANPVFNELTGQGLSSGATRIRLPLPKMADRLPAEQQQGVLEKVSGAKRLEDLTRRSVVAPMILKMEDFALGEAHPYIGSGTCTKITRLNDPADALFVEHHIAFAEPQPWFRGTNMLRSKLPLAIQRGVRDLRRRLIVE